MPLFSYYGQNAGGILDDVPISSAMANASREWLEAFQGCAPWQLSKTYQSRLPSLLTGRAATLATSELELSAQETARGDALIKTLNEFLPRFKEGVQRACAAGICALRPYYEGGRVRVEVVPAGRFYVKKFSADGAPLQAVFLDFEDSPSGSYCRMETHTLTNGVATVENKAYRARGGVLGGEVSMTAVDRWAELPETAEIKGVDRLLFALIRMPMANTVDDSSPLPISLYAEAMDSIRAFDELFNDLIYEMQSGRRRNIIDITALPPEHQPGSMALKKQHRSPLAGVASTYVLVDSAGQLNDGRTKPFDDYSPTMRVEEYGKALALLLRDIERKTGFSPGTFSVDDRRGGVTAREVISSDMETYQTVKSLQERALRPALVDLAYAIDTLDRIHGIAEGPEPEFSIAFGDSIFEDTESEFNRRLLLANAGYLEPAQLIAWYFGCSEERAREMIPQATETIDIFAGG